MKSDNMTKATTEEWYASLFGACFIAFALGVFFAGYFNSTTSGIVLLAGVVLHGWGMMRMHKRNN